MLRFGVLASLAAAPSRTGHAAAAWQLDITDRDSIRTFATEIGIFGKEAALDRGSGRLRK